MCVRMLRGMTKDLFTFLDRCKAACLEAPSMVDEGSCFLSSSRSPPSGCCGLRCGVVYLCVCVNALYECVYEYVKEEKGRWSMCCYVESVRVCV